MLLPSFLAKSIKWWIETREKSVCGKPGKAHIVIHTSRFHPSSVERIHSTDSARDLKFGITQERVAHDQPVIASRARSYARHKAPLSRSSPLPAGFMKSLLNWREQVFQNRPIALVNLSDNLHPGR